MKIFFSVCLTIILIFSFATVAFADYTINVTIEPEGGGTVEGGGAHKAGRNATLVATPSTGYTFNGWYKDKETEPFSTETTFIFEGEADRNYTAKFNPAITVTVTADNAQGGTVSQSGTGSYMPGENVTLTAITSNGYTFSGWFDVANSASAVSTESSYSFVVEESKNIIGKFTPSFELDVAAVPIEGGTVTGSGTYEGNKVATITAVPSDGFKFVGWFPADNTGDPISTQAEFKLNMDTNVSIIARFEKVISDNVLKTIIIIIIGVLVAALVVFFIKKKNGVPTSRGGSSGGSKGKGKPKRRF